MNDNASARTLALLAAIGATLLGSAANAAAPPHVGPPPSITSTVAAAAQNTTACPTSLVQTIQSDITAYFDNVVVGNHIRLACTPR